MRFDIYRAGISGAIVVAALCLSAAGCALTKGDFAAGGSTAPVAASTPLPAPVEVTPAVLIQNGAAPAAPTTTIKSTNTANVDSLPPLPNGNAAAASTAYAGTTPATTNTKQLTPEEKARVVAELEALARGEPATPPAAATKPDCTATATVKTGTAQAANACPPAPKPALRP